MSSNKVTSRSGQSVPDLEQHPLGMVLTKCVKVVHGANDGIFPVVGPTVGMMRVLLCDPFNIRDDAIAFVNGGPVFDQCRLLNGDTLEFVYPFGEKSSSSFLRYPGGKYRQRDLIIRRLKRYLNDGMEYREPFFGGGSIGLELLRTGRLKGIWLNDIDPGLASLWTAVIKYPEELKAEVVEFRPDKNVFASFKNDLAECGGVSPRRQDMVRIAFRKLVVHQLSYSGIGEKSGPLRRIDSRWSPENICHKIDAIHSGFRSVDVRDGCCSCLDVEELLQDDGCVVYLDPPYYEKGPGLYRHSFAPDDHRRLARSLQARRGAWLLSYDDCPDIRNLYSWAKIETVEVPYSAAGSSRKNELLISPKRAG